MHQSVKPIIWLFIFLTKLFTASGQSVNIGLLIPEKSDGSAVEINAVLEFLNKNPDVKTEKIFMSQISAVDDLKRFHVLWLHSNDSVALPPSNLLLDILKQYLKSGGNMLFTLEAFPYINFLGIEPNKVEVRNKTAKDEGYGRQLGLHAFRSHPVFEGLNGGAYIFKPDHDTTVRIHGFFDERSPLNGAVVAVDWDYIFLRENSKLVVEYWTGKGKVLAIGSYIALAQPNKNRQHLELFLNNCLNYLVNSDSKVPAHHWSYYPQVVSKYEQDYAVIINRSSDAWSPEKSVLSLVKEKGGDDYWEVAGERMLVMGKEKGGIDEIWSHPFMALRDYKAGIKLPAGDSILWLNNQKPSIEVLPEAFIRNYSLNSVNLKETIFVSQTDPVGVVHYDYSGSEPAEFFVQFKSNMRLMWPYSEMVFKSIEYSHQTSMNAIMISEGSGDFTSLVGANKEPQLVLTGQYEDYNFSWDTEDKESYCQISGISNEKFEAGGVFYFRLVPGDQFDIIFTAEATNDKSSVTKVINNYKTAINRPSEVYHATREYYSNFLKTSLSIQTPNKVFNEGYQWALVATDRFFVHTPGLGSSLVAGYNTTNTGWDGGHAIDGRPGYSWYFGRDGQWSGFALLDYGDFDKVKSILEMYIKFQDLNGKIYHEVSTSGVVHYDAADATPLFIILAGKYLEHSGDIAFIKSNWPDIKKAIDFCFSTDTDGDHLIENTNVGHGWVEGGILFGTHSSLYLTSCWAEALDYSGFMSNALASDGDADDFQKEAAIVKTIINTDFWNEKANYFYQGKFTDGTFMEARSIMPAIPLYFNQVPEEKAEMILPVFACNNFTSDWGCRIIGEDSPDFNPRGYHTGSVWPLFSGWAALAEYNNGNFIQGYSHIMNNLQIYRHWGLGYIEEVLNGESYEPSGVCRHQCWSETMVLQPAIEGMLGLKVDAIHANLELSPRFPAGWDSVNVNNIRVGQHLINLKMKRVGGVITYDFTHEGPTAIKVNFKPELPNGTFVEKLAECGKIEDYSASNPIKFYLHENCRIEYHTKYGISILPVVPTPKPGYQSTGLRIIRDNLEGNEYTVTLDAQEGTKHTFEVYIQDWKPAKVVNAKIVSFGKNLLKLEVAFPLSDQKYVTKDVKIFLDE